MTLRPSLKFHWDGNGRGRFASKEAKAPIRRLPRQARGSSKREAKLFAGAVPNALWDGGARKPRRI